MKATILLAGLLVLTLGCIQQQSITYICPDGSRATDPSLCPQPAPEHEAPPAQPAPEPAPELPPEENETEIAPPPEAPPNISCYKEDGGDKFFKSTIAVRSGSTIIQQEDDVCLSPTDLKEFYCQGNELRYTTYECSNGCEDGKCNRELVRSECTDTDGGGEAHLHIKGEIIYTYYYSDGTAENTTLITDFCDGTTLNEYSCPGAVDSPVRYHKFELACLGCNDGACPYN